MAVYSRFVKTAKKRIAKYGEECEWTQFVNSEDDDSPWDNPASEPLKHKVKIAFFPNSGNALETLAKALNNEVTIGNVTGFMAAVNFKPSNADTIKRKDGRILTINGIDEVNPNGESVLFTIKATQ